MRNLSVPYWLIAALIAFFFVNLGGYLLFDHDEGAFSEATRGMFERGDFITTYLNDRVRFDKPILIYWLQAASISVFGTDVWAFRLPSALAGFGWSLAIFFFTRRYINQPTAIAAALIAAAALGINMIAHVATADALLNVILASTLLCMYHYSVTPSNKLLFVIYALMALGVLTKGPVAVAIPLMVSAIFFLWSGMKDAFIKAIFFIPGWVLFLLIAAPWYILEYMAQGQAFIDGFILKHNVNRFNNAMEGHDGGPLFYIVLLPFILAPFGALLVRIVPSLKTALGKNGNTNSNTDSTPDLLNRFLWIWFLVVLVLFSIASTKLPHYILYGVTPLVILMARYRDWLKNRWLTIIFPSLFFALMVAFPLLIPTIIDGLTNPIEIAAAERAAEYINQDFAIIAAVAWLLSLALMLWKRISPWFSLILVGVVQTLFVWFIFVPAISEAQQRPVWDAAQFAKQLGEPIITQSIDMPSFNVYFDKWTERRGLEIGEVGYAREDRLRKIPHYDILFQSGPIVIVRRISEEQAQLLEKQTQLQEKQTQLPKQTEQIDSND
ncbi:glycosyltransferase family 39 protein [Bacterioplanoides sp. SCSIO 12839]|uniref:ArnT family glycosyltransferase n=1 Tax=Bacterioplanoides sp. SCSIO 12839 TaxID=2829569 RepID=UPI0021040677|nr:glycosyltransferase family 39 protein [Bacterioplanoides sp. SCSIO 12839]UTW47047.1 glycosyltransferase family 39 protein [Bacterioplanoides sp. SCSIO 12839]